MPSAKSRANSVRGPITFKNDSHYGTNIWNGTRRNWRKRFLVFSYFWKYFYFLTRLHRRSRSRCPTASCRKVNRGVRRHWWLPKRYRKVSCRRWHFLVFPKIAWPYPVQVWPTMPSSRRLTTKFGISIGRSRPTVNWPYWNSMMTRRNRFVLMFLKWNFWIKFKFAGVLAQHGARARRSDGTLLRRLFVLRAADWKWLLLRHVSWGAQHFQKKSHLLFRVHRSRRNISKTLKRSWNVPWKTSKCSNGWNWRKRSCSKCSNTINSRSESGKILISKKYLHRFALSMRKSTRRPQRHTDAVRWSICAGVRTFVTQAKSRRLRVRDFF